jgi:hypothetical protein
MMDAVRNKPILANKIIDLKCSNINNIKKSWLEEMTHACSVTKD